MRLSTLCWTCSRRRCLPRFAAQAWLASWLEALADMPKRDLEARKAFILDAWDQLDETGRFLEIWNLVFM